MKILLPLKDVPIGSIVTKKTGEKKYEVRDHIRIHRESGPDDVNADANTRFLVAKDMGFSIAAVSGDSEVLWEISPEDLYNFIYEKYMADHKGFYENDPVKLFDGNTIEWLCYHGIKQRKYAARVASIQSQSLVFCTMKLELKFNEKDFENLRAFEKAVKRQVDNNVYVGSDSLCVFFNYPKELVAQLRPFHPQPTQMEFVLESSLPDAK